MRMKAWPALFLCALALSCSPEPAPPKPTPPEPAPPAPAQFPPGAAPVASAPTDCGPAVPEQADNVRTAVLESLISQAASDALQHQVALGPIVLAQEERQPGGGVLVHDVAPDFLERFAGRTPPVGNYSTAFMVEKGRTVRTEAPVAFATGEICWSSPTRALVNARKLSSNANRAFRATVEQRDGAWQVASLADRR